MSSSHLTLWGLMLIFLFSACAQQEEPASREDQPGQEESTQTAARSQPAQSDRQEESTQQARQREGDESRSQDQSRQDAPQTPPPASVSLAPGLAKVTAVVVESAAQGNAYLCTLKIQRVHGYGASTPPIPAQTELRATVRKSQVERAGAKGQNLTEKGKTVEVTLKYQAPPAITPPPPSWSVVEIH